MKEKIEKIITDCSIPAVGFCDFNYISDSLIGCRAINRLPENSKTVILCLFPYKVFEFAPDNISRYAAVPDYHKVCMKYLEKIKKRLCGEFPQAQFECFIDNSPIPEVLAAVSAGLGVKGENGLLITEKWGSYVFIGEIVTDLFIPCSDKSESCDGCGECKRRCPVGLNKEKCLSALSQKKGELTPEQAQLLKENNIVWGCDICAECCHKNIGVSLTEITEFVEGYRQSYEIGEDITYRAYEWRGEKTVKRNALL